MIATKMVKIGLIAPGYPKQGGTANYSENLFAAIKTSNLVEIDYLRWNIYGSFWKKLFSPLSKAKLLFNFIRSREVIHIQYHIGDYYPLFLPIVLIFAYKKKVVLTLHEEDGRMPIWIRWFHYFIYSCVNNLIVHNKTHKQKLPRLFHIKTKIIPHGVYDYKIKRKPQKGRILLIGFIHPWKGVDIAARAMSMVTGAQLRIIGKAANKDYALDIKRRFGWNNHIYFKFAYISKNEFIDELKKADVCLLPYREITSSGILADIIGMGVPAIVSDIPTFKEIIPGFVFFKKENYFDLANKMILLLNSKQLRNKTEKWVLKRKKQLTWKIIGLHHCSIWLEHS